MLNFDSYKLFKKILNFPSKKIYKNKFQHKRVIIKSLESHALKSRIPSLSVNLLLLQENAYDITRGSADGGSLSVAQNRYDHTLILIL